MNRILFEPSLVVLLEVWRSLLFEFRRYPRTGEQGELEALGEIEAVDKLKPPAARTGRTAHKQCQISGPVPIPTPSSGENLVRRLLSASTKSPGNRQL